MNPFNSFILQYDEINNANLFQKNLEIYIGKNEVDY